MECKTCKEKSNNKKSPNSDNLEINLIPKSIQEGDYSGNFFFKIIAFVVVTIAIPFIILVLLGQIFMNFFFPKHLPKVSKKFKGFFIQLSQRVVSIHANYVVSDDWFIFYTI